jgi:DNA-binding transcriptional ArsR family regulator
MLMIESSIELVSGPEQAATLLHPLRLRLLEELREPDSASGLARRLDLPRQKVNYHLRELEKENLVEEVEERRKGNCVERILRASARYYLINPAALGPLSTDPEAIADRFSSAYLVAVAARAIRDIATLRERAKKEEKRLPTMSMETQVRFADAEARRRFTKELTTELARLVTKYNDEKSKGGRRFHIFLGSYPRVKTKESESKGRKDDGKKASENEKR